MTVPGPDLGPGLDPAHVPADVRLVSWRSFLRTHAHLMRRLGQDLQNNHQIAITTYDVLLQLAEAPESRLRMSELADAVLLSRSGLTRLVDRLQREGLVQRLADPCDARGLFTVLTPAGRDALRAASVIHLAGVSALVLDRLTDAELAELQRLMAKIDPNNADRATFTVPTTQNVARSG